MPAEPRWPTEVYPDQPARDERGPRAESILVLRHPRISQLTHFGRYDQNHRFAGLFLICVLLAVACSVCGPAAAADAPSTDEQGFVPLFNGRDLAGWEGDSKLWIVEDGMLVGRSPGIKYNDFLATVKTYGDFILRFQIRLLDNRGNSGVQFRSQRVPPPSHEVSGYQADVSAGWWGKLYDESRRNRVLAGPPQDLLDKAHQTGRLERLRDSSRRQQNYATAERCYDRRIYGSGRRHRPRRHYCHSNPQRRADGSPVQEPPHQGTTGEVASAVEPAPRSAQVSRPRRNARPQVSQIPETFRSRRVRGRETLAQRRVRGRETLAQRSARIGRPAHTRRDPRTACCPATRLLPSVHHWARSRRRSRSRTAVRICWPGAKNGGESGGIGASHTSDVSPRPGCASVCAFRPAYHCSSFDVSPQMVSVFAATGLGENHGAPCC